MSDALPLPPRPNLEQYKKLARDLQVACKSSDPDAIRQWAGRWLEALSRSHGHADWLDAGSREREAETLERHWSTAKARTEGPATCTLTAAQFFIAREHGFTSWPRFARHVQDLTRAHSPVAAFEAAADAIVSGDAAALRRLLARHPGLARERSTREHRSTLLHYVSANGVEDFRQTTPKNIVEITNLLLDAGAEVDATSDAYGGGCTTLGLAATSAHPEQAGVQMDLLRALLDRGASLSLPAGGNGHSIVHGCIANGQPAAAKFLADLGAPLDLDSAAAIGRVDVLQSCFDGGARRTEPTRTQIESAFLYACGYGNIDAARFLLDRGVDPAARDEDGQTALHWAAWHPKIDAITLLLGRGAPVDARDVRFHATPLDVALWSWNNAAEDDRDGYYEAVTVLVRAGASLDRDHWRDRMKGDSPVLRRIDSDARMQAALRGETPR